MRLIVGAKNSLKRDSKAMNLEASYIRSVTLTIALITLSQNSNSNERDAIDSNKAHADAVTDGFSLVL